MYNGQVNQHTVFGDLKARAYAVYRVKTQASVYLVGFHEARGRKFVIVRGQPGSDREHVVVRDSDPRVGDRSMFDVPLPEWPGKELEVATMTSSTIMSVVVESDPIAIAAVGIDGRVDDPNKNPWARPGTEPGLPPDASFPAPRPPGMSDAPRIIPNRARGTHPAAAAVGPIPSPVAKAVVVGGAAQPAEAEMPYPERHVLYAENVAALLRSISRRDRLYDDVRGGQRDRLRRALDDAAALLEQIRRRDRK
jgi:hypothetical protein